MFEGSATGFGVIPRKEYIDRIIILTHSARAFDDDTGAERRLQS
jgi:hypothetical protein